MASSGEQGPPPTPASSSSAATRNGGSRSGSAVMMTKPHDAQPMTADELDTLARTPVIETLSNDALARALTSPPFVLLASRDTARSRDASAPIACLNFRDAASAERTPELRIGRIFRAGKSAFDGRQLARIGIAKVYDLRSEKECVRDPHAKPAEMAGVEVVWYAPTSSLAEHFSKARARGDDVDDAATSILVGSYMSILVSHKQILREILLDLARLRVDADDALLLHCTAGKDRTGVTVAMLASLAGCTPDGIARDYALTRIGIEPARERLINAMRSTVPDFSVDDPRFRALSESRYEDMLAFLQLVQKTYDGGFEGYVQSILQLSQEQLDAAKRSLRVKTRL